MSNTDKGTLVRIPIGAPGAAGAITTMAQGINWIDDFTLTGGGNTVLAAED